MPFDEEVKPPIGGWYAYCAWAREHLAPEDQVSAGAPRGLDQDPVLEEQNAPRHS
jgi:hypothetical protein